MRGMVVMLCVIAAMTCGSAAAAVATSEGTSVADVAVGAGTFGPGCTIDSPTGPFCTARHLSFQLSAVELATGDVVGTFTRTNLATGFVFSGPVTCVRTDGRTAVVGGIVTRPASPPGIPFLVNVRDGATSLGDGIGPFQIFPPGDPAWAYLPGDFPATCPAAVSLLGYFPLTTGGAFVHEG